MPRSLSLVTYPITEAEQTFLRNLALSGAEFMVVGLTAAILQGADVSTKDIDLWVKHTSDGRLAEAARSVGGVFIWRANPPCLDGKELSRLDLVNRLDGLGSFEDEYAISVDCQIVDFKIRLLRLDRIIASKRAAARDKDMAALPALMAAYEAAKHL